MNHTNNDQTQDRQFPLLFLLIVLNSILAIVPFLIMEKSAELFLLFFIFPFTLLLIPVAFIYKGKSQKFLRIATIILFIICLLLFATITYLSELGKAYQH